MRLSGFRAFGASMIAVIALTAAGCDKEPLKPAQPTRPSILTVPGKVLTIRTAAAGERPILHLVALGEGKVRLGNEADRWRLIDVANKSVIFVDDVARTFRTVPLQDLARERRSVLGAPLPPSIPRAKLKKLGGTRTFGAFPAAGYEITMGGYRRELWLSREVILAPDFLTLFLASEPLGEEYGGVMRNVLGELALLQGFPVHDRAEMSLGTKTLTIERTLVKVEQKNAPAIWFRVPDGYRDLTPPAATTPAAGRRPASSAPRGRTTPAAE